MCKIFVAVLLALACSQSVLSAECHGKPDPQAQPNLNAIYAGVPRFIRSVKNAKLYQAGPATDLFNIVHLWGTPYEMGYAHGTLLNATATNMVNAVWGYLEQQVEQAINSTVHNLKPWFVALVAEFGLDEALDLTYNATVRHTGRYFGEEMQGMADATNLSLKKIQRIHMIGELTKGACSMYGAWGTATQSTGSLMQMRCLDWDVDGPFRNFPQITVYHPTPNSGNGHAFANIGWTGWLGSITGISSQQMAISEIGVAFPDDTFGSESRFGVPFTYLLRDVLQFDESLAAAEMHITSAARTCDLILGVGDGKEKQFRGIQYSASVANFYTDSDMQPTADWHPRLKDVVYYGMDWLCPGFNQVLYNQLNKYHGNITAANTVHDLVSIVQSGDLHIAVYDLSQMTLHIANARQDNSTGPLKAYDRTFTQLNMTKIFAETQ